MSSTNMAVISRWLLYTVTTVHRFDSMHLHMYIHCSVTSLKRHDGPSLYKEEYKTAPEMRTPPLIRTRQAVPGTEGLHFLL